METHTFPFGHPTISAPTLNASKDPLVEQLRSLRPAKRSFMARWRSDPVIAKDSLGFAKLMHARLQGTPVAPGAPGRAKAVAQFWKGQFDRPDSGLRTDNQTKLFDAAQKLATDCPDATRAMLESASDEDVLAALTAEFTRQGRSPKKAEALAQVVYAALVAKAGTSAHDRVEGEFTKRLDAHEAAPETLARHDRLLGTLDKLKSAKDLSGNARLKLLQRAMNIEGIRTQGLAVYSRERVEAVREAVTIHTDAPALDAYRAELGGLRQRLQEQPDAGSAGNIALRQQLDQSVAFLDVLARRSKDLDGVIGCDKLKTVLAGLDATRYVAARQGLEHIVATTQASQQEVLGRLNERITDASQVRWITDIRHGDPGIVDMVFSGAEWHEDAYRMKRAVIADDDRPALKNLDVQHNLRVAALALDEAMQHESFRRGGSALPAGAFRALKADPKLIAWFRNNAPGAVADVDLVIADWIRLSLYDPKTGCVDDVAARQALNALGMEGLDTEAIQQYLQRGFSSVASVVACSDQIRGFASAIKDASLLKDMEQARSLRFRAEGLACRLFEQATGFSTATISSNEVGERMAAAMRERNPQATSNLDERRLGLEAERDKLQDSLLSGWKVAEGADRQWLKDPAKLEKQQQACTDVLAALHFDAALKDKSQVAGRENNLKLRDQHLEALRHFSVENLRREPSQQRDSEPGPWRIGQLKGVEEQIRSLQELHRLNRNIDQLEVRARPTAEGRQFIRQAMQIAILQEAVAIYPGSFSPQENVGAILKRMAGFGISMTNANSQMRQLLATVASELTTNEKDLASLCTAIGRDAAIDSVKEKLAGPARRHSEVATSPADQRRRLHADLIKDRFDKIKPGESFSIRFGTFGEVVASAPVVPGLGVAYEARHEKGNSIIISCEAADGYTVRIASDRRARHGLSLSGLGELLKLSGYTQGEHADGNTFTLTDRGACQALATALANGDSIDHVLASGARVQQVTREARAIGANIAAGANLSLASLSLEAAVSFGGSVETLQSANGVTEIISQQSSRTASARAELAAGKGSARHEAGVSVTERRTLVKQFGMFSADSGRVASAVVIGGNTQDCLSRVLPPGREGELQAYLARLGTIEDGTEIFVRSRLSAAALRKGNEHLAQAKRHVHEAAIAGATSVERDAAHKAAREAVRAAYALTQDPENYIPEGLGWTSKALVEVSRNRALYTRFAAAEDLATEFLPFETGTSEA